MEKRKSKLVVFSVISLVFAIGFGVIAVVFGALNKDNWIDVSKKLRLSNGLHETPVFVEIELDSISVNKLFADVSGGNLNISYYDGDKIKASYYEEYSNESVVSVNGGALKIDRELLLGSVVNCTNSKLIFSLGFDWFLYKDYMDINVMLPSSLEFDESDIEISGGKLNADSIRFGKSKLKTSGGTLNIKSATFLNTEVKISGGTANIESTSFKKLSIDVSGGLVVMDKSDCVGLDLDISGGRFKSTSGHVGDYIEIDTSGGTIMFEDFPYMPQDLSFNLDISGGRFTLNGDRIASGKSGSHSPSCQIKAEISGGTIQIKTV